MKNLLLLSILLLSLPVVAQQEGKDDVVKIKVVRMPFYSYLEYELDGEKFDNTRHIRKDTWVMTNKDSIARICNYVATGKKYEPMRFNRPVKQSLPVINTRVKMLMHHRSGKVDTLCFDYFGAFFTNNGFLLQMPVSSPRWCIYELIGNGYPPVVPLTKKDEPLWVKVRKLPSNVFCYGAHSISPSEFDQMKGNDIETETVSDITQCKKIVSLLKGGQSLSECSSMDTRVRLTIHYNSGRTDVVYLAMTGEISYNGRVKLMPGHGLVDYIYEIVPDKE